MPFYKVCRLIMVGLAFAAGVMAIILTDQNQWNAEKASPLGIAFLITCGAIFLPALGMWKPPPYTGPKKFWRSQLIISCTTSVVQLIVFVALTISELNKLHLWALLQLVAWSVWAFIDYIKFINASFSNDIQGSDSGTPYPGVTGIAGYTGIAPDLLSGTPYPYPISAQTVIPGTNPAFNPNNQTTFDDGSIPIVISSGVMVVPGGSGTYPIQSGATPQNLQPPIPPAAAAAPETPVEKPKPPKPAGWRKILWKK